MEKDEAPDMVASLAAAEQLFGINLHNVAALTAFLAGDIANACVAGTPGGIEAQEAAGQAAFVQASVLPRDCKGGTRADLETLGFGFGPEDHDLFVAVTFPPGWTKRATAHVMWSDLLDAHGRKRASLFYKAAFYDRSAYMRLEPRYTYRSYFGAYPERDAPYSRDVVRWVGVVDTATGAILWHSADHRSDDYPAGDAADQAAAAWIDEHYPDWRNSLAYWDAESVAFALEEEPINV